jgi:hypothetical protein
MGGQAGLLVRLAHGGFLDGLVAVAGTAGQPPRPTLMAPRRAVLKQHRRGAVPARSTEQESGGAMDAPEVGAVVRQHPTVTVATHGFRIGTSAEIRRLWARYTPNRESAW